MALVQIPINKLIMEKVLMIEVLSNLQAIHLIILIFLLFNQEGKIKVDLDLLTMTMKTLLLIIMILEKMMSLPLDLKTLEGIIMAKLTMKMIKMMKAMKSTINLLLGLAVLSKVRKMKMKTLNQH